MARSTRALLPRERNAVLGLASILSLRMLGFYAVLPILSAYAATMPGARPLLIGLTVGMYGLTQALFQVPFGVLSDRYGRRVSILVGLMIFAAGSFVAGAADDIGLLLVGRSLQGAGAVASVIIALAADLTRPVARTRAMAFLGMAIGLSFGIGFVIGPPAASELGVSWLFNLTGVLSIVAGFYVAALLPRPERHESTDRVTIERALSVLRRRELVILNWGTLSVHLCLTCLFVVAPVEIERHVAQRDLWKFYLPIIVAAMWLLSVAARRADHPGWARPILWTGTSLLAIACLVLGLSPSNALFGLLAGIVVFTWGMALAEPILPALLTRFAPQEMRGAAAGVFNVHQFAGAFLGGLVGGAALGTRELFLVLAALLVGWTIVAFRLPNPFRVEIARRRRERRSEPAGRDA